MAIKLIPILISTVMLTFPIPSEVMIFGSEQTAKGDVIVANVAEAATPKFDEANTTLKMWVTAYSSTPDQTDDTPFITASGTTVRDGIVATNELPFGTKVMIPKLFGDKVFIVEDRMHRRKKNFIDIWMPTRQDALNVGIGYLDVVVLN